MQYIATIMRKEFRELAPVWVALYAFIIVGILACHLPGWFGAESGLLRYPYASVGLTCFMLYVFFASILSFVREVEEKRYGFLRCMPLDVRTVAWGKIAGILVSSVFFAIATLLTSLIMAAVCGTGYREDLLFLLSRHTVLALESFCLGLYVSVRCRRIYTAVIIGTVALFLFDVLVTNAATEALERFGHTRLKYRDAITSPWVIGTKLFLLLGFARNMFGAFDWYRLQESPLWFASCFHGRRRGRLSRVMSTIRSRPNLLWTLIWQCWRSSWLLLLGMTAIVLLFLLLLPTGGIPYLLVLWGAFFLYCWILPTQAFYAEFHREEGLMLARMSAPPRFVWLSRAIVFGSCVGSVAMIFLLVTLSSYDPGDRLLFWSRLSDMQLHDLLIPDHSQMKTMAPTHIFMILIAIPAVFFGALSAGAIFRSRILAMVSFGPMLLLPILAFFFYEGSHSEFYFPLMLVSTIFLMVVSWYSVRCQLRRRKNPAKLYCFFVSVLLGLLVLFFPQFELILLPKESLPFEPDRSLLAIPYNVNERLDAADFRLEEDLVLPLVTPQWPYTIWDANSAGLGRSSKDAVSRLLRLDDLEALWDRYCRIYRESTTAFGTFSTQIEAIIVQSIQYHQAGWTPDQRRRAGVLLARIPRERPSMAEQYKRFYQLMCRVTDVTEPGNDYPFCLSHNGRERCKPAVTKIFLGNRLGSLCRVMMEYERFLYRDDRGASALRARLLQDRVDKWTFQCRAHELFTPHIGESAVNPFQTERLRRALFLVLALTTWRQEQGSWPDSLDELVQGGYLKEIPNVAGYDEPFKMSTKFAKPVEFPILPDSGADKKRVVPALFEYENKGGVSPVNRFPCDLLSDSCQIDIPRGKHVLERSIIRSATPIIYDRTSTFAILVPEPRKESQ